MKVNSRQLHSLPFVQNIIVIMVQVFISITNMTNQFKHLNLCSKRKRKYPFILVYAIDYAIDIFNSPHKVILHGKRREGIISQKMNKDIIGLIALSLV